VYAACLRRDPPRGRERGGTRHAERERKGGGPRVSVCFGRARRLGPGNSEGEGGGILFSALRQRIDVFGAGTRRLHVATRTFY